MKKRYSVAIFAGGLILASTLVASLADAETASRWTLTVPDGISFSVGNGERTHALRIFRDENGNLVRSSQNQLDSGNWSGYVLTNYETGKTYTSAAGTWIVSPATAPTGQSAGYASSWVGIGGFCENNSCTRGDGTLIQLGTESDAGKLGTNYYAWYETLPESETLISGLTVHPGDQITASLTLDPSSEKENRLSFLSQSRQTWILTMTDLTSGKTWTKNVSYQSSELSADWIEEAPSSNSGILPLANYVTATFNPEGNLSFSPANEVVMFDPHGEISNPSALVSADNFSTCFSYGTYPSTPGTCAYTAL